MFILKQWQNLKDIHGKDDFFFLKGKDKPGYSSLHDYHRVTLHVEVKDVFILSINNFGDSILTQLHDCMLVATDHCWLTVIFQNTNSILLIIGIALMIYQVLAMH